MARIGSISLLLCLAACATAAPDSASHARTLMQLLRDPDPDVRAGAVQELRSMQPAIDALLHEHTQDADAEVASWCRQLLSLEKSDWEWYRDSSLCAIDLQLAEYEENGPWMDIDMDTDALIRQLEDESPEVRERAAAQLKSLGAKALPQLKRSSNAHAGSIAARIEWEPFVPLRVEAKDATIFDQLASGDPAAFDRLWRADARSWPLHRKVLLEGPPAMKRRALAVIEAADYGPRRIAIVLDALPHATDTDIAGPAGAIVQSARAENADRLRELARRDDPVRTAALLGLAALGDADAQKAAIVELRSPASWRRMAASAALKRSPTPAAGPTLRELLDSADADAVLATIDALEAYPDVDLREPLVKLLSFAHKESWVAESVRTSALQLIANRKYDEAARVWPLVKNGTLKSTPPSVGGDHGSGRVGWALAHVLSVGDDPAFVDRVDELRELSWYDYVGVYDALHGTALPPRIDARFRAIAAGKEKTSEECVGFAADYVRTHAPPPPPPDEVLARLEKTPNIDTLGGLPPNESLSDAQRERLKRLCLVWLAQKDHPLRDGAAYRLHKMGVKEGTDRLVEMAERNPYLLSDLFDDPRAVEVARKHAKRDSWALWMLAEKKDPSVPALVLESFRERLHQVSGHGLGYLLAKYSDRDFTDELLPLLTDETPAAHVEQILAYLRLRGRKDQVALMRKHVTHAGGSVRREAIQALAEWRDAESFDSLVGLIVKAPWDTEVSVILGALTQIDPDRARPHIVSLFESADYQRRSAAYFAFPRIARREDGALIVRLLQTDSHAAFLAESAGRLGMAETAPALLDILDQGYGGYAATGLAYLGERAAVPLLVERMDAFCLSALDFIVNRAHYPSLSERKAAREGWMPFAEGRECVRKTFCVEIAPTAPPAVKHLQFAAESDLVEFLGRNSIEGRYGHIWRDGAMHLVTIEEARVYWKSWWERHRADWNLLPQSEPSVEELLRTFLQAGDAESAKAREAVVKRGADALPFLADLRARGKSEKRYEALLELSFDLKKAAARDEQARKAFAAIAEGRVTFRLREADVQSVVDLLAQLLKTHLAVDSAALGKVDIDLANDTGRTALDDLAAKLDLDYDFRYGVLFVSTPARLWPEPKPQPVRALTEAETKAAREWIGRLGSDSIDEREKAAGELRQLGRRAMALLEEGAASASPDTAARCKALLDAVKPRKLGFSPLPASNAWTSQDLKDRDADVAKALREKRVSAKILGEKDLIAGFEPMKLGAAVDLLSKLSGVQFSLDAALKDATLRRFAAKDLAAQHLLELITLPYGLDARIEKGEVVISRR